MSRKQTGEPIRRGAERLRLQLTLLQAEMDDGAPVPHAAVVEELVNLRDLFRPLFRQFAKKPARRARR
jgi:hypothetical protein